MTRLVLFDIDGTILSSQGAAAKAFLRALREVYGAVGPLNGYSFGGRTDPQIARDLLALAGFDARTIAAGMEALWRRYLELLEEESSRVETTVYPGVPEILDRLDAAREIAILGLLTGNLVEGARLKLRAAGIEMERFPVGAFGSDHHDRSELPAIAIQRAEAGWGRRFAGKEVVIIGDTPFDISCGEHLGVRTIAVATGTYGPSALAECRPDHLFADLSDTEAVWRAIFA